MNAVNQKDIKACLNKALITHGSLDCVLHQGLPESEYIHQKNPVLYTKIQFHPDSCYKGYYGGRMFFPNGKSQGVMDFNVISFASVADTKEA